jgi:hypothetical protein
VAGDKAYSWATKKGLPASGEAILIYEQPVHTADYALSKRIEIPDGQYGAGVTTLDFARKARLGENSTKDKFVLHEKDGTRYLFKRLDEEKYGKKAWLLKSLPVAQVEKRAEDTRNRYIDVLSVLLCR